MKASAPTSGSRRMQWSYLGELAYADALALQLRFRTAVQEGRAPDTLLLLQHPPVITLGRSAHASNVLVSEEERRRRGVELARVSRGGDVTYHGPGQLVGYPVRRVGKAIRTHVEGMVGSIREVLGSLGIETWWEPCRPGVWCAQGKIAALGVDARGGVAIHGFALNVCTPLTDFGMIVPCGLQAAVTSIDRVLKQRVCPSVEEVAREIAPIMAQRYGAEPEEVSSATLTGAVA